MAMLMHSVPGALESTTKHQKLNFVASHWYDAEDLHESVIILKFLSLLSNKYKYKYTKVYFKISPLLNLYFFSTKNIELTYLPKLKKMKNYKWNLKVLPNEFFANTDTEQNQIPEKHYWQKSRHYD